MKITQNKVVVLSYELTVDGQIADRATKEHPLDYIHGTHMLIPKFEAEIDGKEPGDSFAFTLLPQEGYGEYEPKYRFDIPKSTFVVDGQLREDLLVVGNMIPMLNGSGEVCQARIVEIKDEAVNMDFNHTMAGKTLNFKGEILGVRDATEKELREGLHGEYLPKEDCCCGCNCGHSHDGEGCCEGEECCCHK